ncbi:MAG: Competence transcription factor [Bacillales bacterium]|nr:Competence transcription factor [Bacillales bacterium]
MEVRTLENYEIHQDTIALLPHFFNNGEIGTLVLESDGCVYIRQEPLKIIDSSCQYYGSSYRGRKEGTRTVIQITHKAPIAISSSNGIYFFPTMSPTLKDCIWISQAHVLKSDKVDITRTNVTFTNGSTYIIDISRNSFENQFLRATKLKSMLDTRSGFKKMLLRNTESSVAEKRNSDIWVLD